WSSDNTGIATVTSPGGAVYGVSGGTTVITYTLPSGCYATAIVTVDTLPSGISGTLQVCAGSATSLTDGGGGAWSSSNTAIAHTEASGMVYGIVPGTTVITYTLPTSCQATATVTVNPLPAGIGGAGIMCAGATSTLLDGGGGTWSSGNTSVATVGTAASSS